MTENKLIFVGEIKFISEEEIIVSKDKTKEYTKQYFICADTKEYPNEILFEVFNKPETISGYKDGDIVEVEYNSKVSEYNGKHYGSLSAWKVNRLVGTTPSTSNERCSTEELPTNEGTSDNLPF